jgi:hypothetical protein
VRKREAKLGLKELSNVRPSDILRLFNLHDAEDLQEISFSTQTGNISRQREREREREREKGTYVD